MQLIIPSSVKEIKKVSNTILTTLNGSPQAQDSFLFDVRLACEETLINAIKHGNKKDKEKKVIINFDVTEKGVVISVEDEGQGYNYHQLPDPRHVSNLLRTGGRGLFLIRKMMDKIEFNEKGNKITMTKYF